MFWTYGEPGCLPEVVEPEMLMVQNTVPQLKKMPSVRIRCHCRDRQELLIVPIVRLHSIIQSNGAVSTPVVSNH